MKTWFFWMYLADEYDKYIKLCMYVRKETCKIRSHSMNQLEKLEAAKAA